MLVPTPRELRWSFLVVGMCAFALALTLCWAVVQRVDQGQAVVHTAASEADQIQRLSKQLDDQAATSAQGRATLIEQNRTQSAELAATTAELHVLVAILRAHGIAIPKTVIGPPSTSNPGVTRPKVPHAGTRRPHHHPHVPAAPVPTSTSPANPVTSEVCRLLPMFCGLVPLP